MLRRRVVAAASIVAWLTLACPPLPAAAIQGGASLFAIQNPTLLPSVVRVDPPSGTLSTVADLSTLPNTPVVGPLAASSQSSLIYAVATYCSPTPCGGCPKACGSGVPTSEILAINAQTAAVHVSPVVASPLFGGIALDPATQTLWALTPPPPGIPGANPSVAILRVDPTTGAENTVATHTGEVDTMHSWVALDPASHVLYVAVVSDVTGAGQLLALDTSTGTMSTGLSLAAPVSGLVFDISSGTLFGLTTGSPEHLAKIDPTTGIEAVVATLGANISVKGSTIDSASHTVFGVENNSLTSSVEIVTINDQTGAISVGAPVPATIDSLAVRERSAVSQSAAPSSPAPRGVSKSAPSTPGPRAAVTRSTPQAYPINGVTRPGTTTHGTDGALGDIWTADEWIRFLLALLALLFP